MLATGSSLKRVADEHPEAFIRYHKGLRAFKNTIISQRDEPPEVTLYYGPTGCGKTSTFYNETQPDDRWRTPLGKGGWFDDYDGESDVLFDEFGGKMSHWSLTDFLQVIDRYSLRVPFKGGFVDWVPKHIHVASNYHPKIWWDFSSREESFRALKRRFTRVVWWTGSPSPPHVLQRNDADREAVAMWDHFWQGPPPEIRHELGPLDDYVVQPGLSSRYRF